jgi:hypothetical protein
MMMRCLLSTLVILSIGCSKQTAEPAAPIKEEAPAKAPAAAAEIVKTGAPIGHDNVVAVGEVLANAASLKGKSVRVSGKIEQVCQKKGCWMELAGSKPGESLRITAKDYGFFFPISSNGHNALVEGQLEVSELSVEDAQHIEDERKLAPGEQPKKITAPVQQVSIVAVGAEINPQAG